MVIAAFVGRLIQRAGAAAVLAVAGVCGAVGGVCYAVAPGLWLVLCVGPLVGAGMGMMDGGLNTAVGLTGRTRLLNLLHGFYGVGTAIGPLVVTAAIIGGSWRPAYLVLGRAQRGDRRLLDRLPPECSRSGGASRPSGSRTQRRGARPRRMQPAEGWSQRRVVTVLALGLIVFFLYTGLEVAAGQWETSFLRGQLGLSASAAGLAAFGYWGALTAVRIGLALPARQVPAQTVIGSGLLTAIVASGLIWLAARTRLDRPGVRRFSAVRWPAFFPPSSPSPRGGSARNARSTRSPGRSAPLPPAAPGSPPSSGC